MNGQLLKELHIFLRETYGMDGAVTRIDGGLNNDNFVVTTPHFQFHLKWYYPDTPKERLQREAEAFLLLNGGTSVGVPKFIPTLKGELRSLFDGRVISCFSFLTGHRMYSLIEAPTLSTTSRSMGRALAILHNDLHTPRAVPAFPFSALEPPPPGCRLSNLIDYCAQGTSEVLSSVEVAKSLRSIERSINLLAKLNQPFLRIHGDFQAGNLFFEGEEVVEVCDFEYSDWEFRVFDCAMSVSILLSSSGLRGLAALQLCQDFLGSYQMESVVPWSPIESESLGSLVSLSLLLNASWAVSRKDDPLYHEIVVTFLKQTLQCYTEWNDSLTSSQFLLPARKGFASEM